MWCQAKNVVSSKGGNSLCTPLHTLWQCPNTSELCRSCQAMPMRHSPQTFLRGAASVFREVGWVAGKQVAREPQCLQVPSTARAGCVLHDWCRRAWALFSIPAVVPHISEQTSGKQWVVRQKIAQAAENEGLQPQEICDRYCSHLGADNASVMN